MAQSQQLDKSFNLLIVWDEGPEKCFCFRCDDKPYRNVCQSQTCKMGHPTDYLFASLPIDSIVWDCEQGRVDVEI